MNDAAKRIGEEKQRIVADLSLADSIESTDPQEIFDWALIMLFTAIVIVMVVSIF